MHSDVPMVAIGHGKVILLGEHSVVHGRPALALSVEPGAEVTAKRIEADRTKLHIEPWGVDVDSGPAANEGRESLQRALRIARAFYDDGVELSLTATMHLPSGAGMGSSAALGVAVLRALDEARGLTRPADEIYERSLAWERVFHGTPSGIDNAMATYGGMALFKRGEPLTRIAAARPVKLVVGYSGSSSSTSEMVASVRAQLEAEPARVNPLFDKIAACVLDGRAALERGDLATLGRRMSENHEHLRALGLTTPQLDEMNERALATGALGAKVTGAGGGGCMVALVDGDESARAVRHALRELDRVVYEVGSGS